MMALETCPLQGSCRTFPSLPSSSSRGSKFKYFVPIPHAVGRKDRLTSLKYKSYSSVEASLVLGPKSKLCRISAFKGSSRHDDSRGRATGSNSLKKPVKVSYLQHESKESSMESFQVQNVVPAPRTSADETTTRSLAIQNLFKNWLMLLHTPPQNQLVDKVFEEPSSTDSSEVPKIIQKKGKGAALKSFCFYYLGLDATIKIPLLIFTPLFLAVNLVYGPKVSKELAPLWILGPLFVVLYVKMFRAICELYVFSFKQTIKLAHNLPVYYLLVRDLIVCRKLKEAIRKQIWQPMEDIKNMNYNEVSRGKMKDLQGWLMEKYLDCVESIWPYYCRTIRFLKRANLI
ncbi:hypothetical protein ACJIZ3_009955 [Penstemon smallii]|uniref:Embryo defective 2759 n=1 Tax=Penstemon smallii TaxID=265156 RepID=A0ABD3TDZ9_9LAMI